VYGVRGEDELSDRLEAVEGSNGYCGGGGCAELERLRAIVEGVPESGVGTSLLAEWVGEEPCVGGERCGVDFAEELVNDVAVEDAQAWSPVGTGWSRVEEWRKIGFDPCEVTSEVETW
jgi:hypothetical protein